MDLQEITSSSDSSSDHSNHSIDIEMTDRINITKSEKPIVSPPSQSRALNPEVNASYLSLLTFSFADQIISDGYNRELKDDNNTSDIWETHPLDNTENLCNEFNIYWNTYKNSNYPLFNALYELIKIRLSMIFILQLLQRISGFAGPLLLQAILSFLLDPTLPISVGYEYAILLFLSTLIGAILNSHAYNTMTRGWTQIRSLITILVYRKAIRLTVAGRGSTGEITNHMSSDADKIGSMMMGLGDSIMVPIQIAVILIFLYYTVGVATFAGFAVVLFLFPLMGLVMFKIGDMTKDKNGLSDTRVKFINEVLQGIRVVRFYAWEESFIEQITGVRNDEVNLLKSLNFTRSMIVLIFMALPPVVSLVTFSTFASIGGVLTVPLVFRAMAFFNMLRWSMLNLPTSLNFLISGFISINRVQKFLMLPEITENAIEEVDAEKSTKFPIYIENGSFSWSNDNEIKITNEDTKLTDVTEGSATLKDIDFFVPHGSLTAVVGSVGSGKSSLLLACLGEMNNIGENKKQWCKGPVGYVPQTAWIQNMSVRENILFGKPFDLVKYQRVIEACALLPDIAVLPALDFTEIGDRGVNLSGGQKQRISLARAVYADFDVLILDDPFSAVDATVGNLLFFNCLKTLLKSKTILLVTNHIHFLPNCDYVYVLNHGRIEKRGTYKELIDTGYSFENLSDENEEDIEDESSKNILSLEKTNLGPRLTSKSSAKSVKFAKDSDNSAVLLSIDKTKIILAENDEAKFKAGLKLVEDEQKNSGVVSLDVYLHHFQKMGGWSFFILFAFFFFVSQVALVASDLWIGYWSSNYFTQSHNWYMLIYAGISILFCLLLGGRALIMAYGSAAASKEHHSSVLNSVLHSTSRFFDATPTGRILNRFSKDTDDIDNILPNLIENVVAIFFMILGSMVTVGIIYPIFFVVIVVIVLLYGFIQRYYSPAALQLQRIEATSRSPLYQHFSETLNGVSVVRGFHSILAFEKQNQNATEKNISSFQIMRLIFRWAILRIEACNSIVQLVAALIIVSSRNTLDPSLAGVSLNLILGFSGILGISVMLATELENRMNAVERVIEYSNDIEQDKAWQCPETDSLLPETWPSVGKIEFENVTVKYRENLEPALKNVSLSINSLEKIGVAGRTGSGKSTLMLCLFRMYDLVSGRILIDNVDISTIGLHTLRRKLAIIPQDAVMFSGTLRRNMDPFNEFTDDEIWKAFQLCNLKEFIENDLPEKLNTPVAEYGSNFSQGQRQLVCMGRAVLRKPIIMVLDEATSSVDHATDAIIQESVREQFANSTVLTIAHRLNTIMDADRILILDKGLLNEFDTPKKLIENDGIFASMYRASQ